MSREWELAKDREAHWHALAATATLEEQIELSRWATWTQLDVCFCSPSQDRPRRRPRGQSQRCCMADSLAGSPMHSLSGPFQWVAFADPKTSEEDWAARQPSPTYDLGPSWELGPDLKCFLQEPATMQGEGKGGDVLPEALAGNYERWIKCRWCWVHTPKWWQEFLGIDDFQELTQKIRASFEIPRVRSEALDIDNDYSAPPAPKCICQKDLLPPPNLMFPSQDFREGQSHKTLAYAQALQYWVEKVSPPIPDQPHLLARCV